MKEKVFLVAAVIISSITHGQTTATTDSDSIKNLKEVIVTANKIEQKPGATGKVMTVINRDELQRNAGKSVGEILNQQVGIVIGGAQNTPGTVQSVYTRGAAPANTLIMMDGIPLYDASGISNEFDLNSFVTDEIERIEILKGSQSTLYGSDAVAGVINIITKKQPGKKTGINVNLSGGSYGTLKGSFQLKGLISKGINYNIGYTKFHSDGFSSAFDSTAKGGFDNDKFDQDALLAGIGFKLAKKLYVRTYVKQATNRSEIDAGAFTDDKDYHYKTNHFTVGTAMEYSLHKAKLFLNYNFNNYERKYNNDSVDIGGYDPNGYYLKYIKEKYSGKNHFTELYANVTLNQQLALVAGADYRNASTSQEYLYVSNYGDYIPPPLGEDTAKTHQEGIYASLLFNNNKGFSAGLGGRYNHHSVYGTNGTFSINPAYTFQKIKLFVNISSAYRVPSLYQLYSEFGNLDLKPEKTMSYEAGIQVTYGTIRSRLVSYWRDTKDVFAFYTDYTDPFFPRSKYINEDRQKDLGLEWEGFTSINSKLDVSANFTYVKGELTTKDVNRKDTAINNVYRCPKNFMNFEIVYRPTSKIVVSGQLRNTSSRYEPKYMAMPVKLSGYYTANLYCSYQFSKVGKIYVNLKNITDQEYFDEEGFESAGFNLMGGLVFTF